MGMLTNMLAKALFESQLMEMMIDRNSFIKRMKAQVPQIIQNWCLVMWVSETHNNNLQHWRNEFISSVLNVSSIDITKMSSSASNKCKLKAIEKYFDEEDYCTRPEPVLAVIIKKVEFDEKVPHDEVMRLCRAFNRDAEVVMELMASYDYEATVKYINSL